jgi:RND superfamily putative drug exporter
MVVVTRAPLARAQQYALALPLDGRARVTQVERVTDDLSVVDLDVHGGALGDQARALVDELSAQRPGFDTYVVGQASALKDFVASMLARAPVAFGLVALATLVLLFLMTGSVVIPVKALLLNVVSLGAAVGVITWVFQHGHLQGLLGFASVGAVESTIPLLVLAFGFGLSMDYEVFLISRIVELHERGYPNDDSVVVGLQRSGRIITSAAVLVVIVFSGFAAGKLLVIKEIGVGLAVAVLLDATLVRMLLVPATMTLLGDWNWWAPRSLRRWHARFGITE